MKTTSNNLAIKTIKPKRVADQVYDQLRELIYRGLIKPGEKLMPERKMAETMGVSRTSVREAINKLVTMGLLTHRQGQGTFLRQPDEHPANPMAIVMESQEASLFDLLEVRIGMECHSASLAAERADKEDIEFLKNSQAEMEQAFIDGKPGTDADVSFHMAVAYASKNPLQIYLMKNMYDFLFASIKKNRSHLYRVPGNIELIIKQHRAVYEAISRRDKSGAFEAMRQHIQFVQDFFVAHPWGTNPPK